MTFSVDIHVPQGMNHQTLVITLLPLQRHHEVKIYICIVFFCFFKWYRPLCFSDDAKDLGDCLSAETLSSILGVLSETIN